MSRAKNPDSIAACGALLASGGELVLAGAAHAAWHATFSAVSPIAM